MLEPLARDESGRERSDQHRVIERDLLPVLSTFIS